MEKAEVPTWASILTFLGLIATPLVTYLVVVRGSSGDIDKSASQELWDESRSIREDYRERLDASAARQVDLEKRVAHLEGLNYALTTENSKLKQHVAELEAHIEDLEGTIAQLQTLVKQQQAIIDGEVVA